MLEGQDLDAGALDVAEPLRAIELLGQRLRSARPPKSWGMGKAPAVESGVMEAAGRREERS